MKKAFQKLIAAALCATMTASAVALPSSSLASVFKSDFSISASAADKQYGDFSYVENSDGTVTLTKYNGHGYGLTTPSYINGKRVKQIGNGYRSPFISLENGKNLRTVTVGDYTSTLAGGAFVNCPNLVSAFLPYTLRTIESSAFGGCKNLSNVSLSGMPDVWPSAFCGCDKLTNTDSVRGATALLLGGVNIQTISGSPIYTDNGRGNKPTINFGMEFLFTNRRDATQDLTITRSYTKRYAEYIVIKVLKLNTSMTQEARAKAIYNWVCSKASYDNNEFRYVYKNGKVVDIIKVPNPLNHTDGSVFFSNKTVCDGYARALDLMFRAAGLTSYFVSTDEYERSYTDVNGVPRTKTISHAFSIVRINGRYCIMDATCGDSGYDYSVSQMQSRTNDISNWKISTPTPLHYSSTMNLSNILY